MREGIAIWIRTTAGRRVQMHSIACPSSIRIEIDLLFKVLQMTVNTRTVIELNTIRVKSWKKINSSITGEAPSCNPHWAHVIILSAYACQSKNDFSHSTNKPIVNTSKKQLIPIKDHTLPLGVLIYGKRRISSISNTKKIKLTRKKCTEMGDRLSSYLVNPHSKGLLFSMSAKPFHLNIIISTKSTLPNKITKAAIPRYVFILGFSESLQFTKLVF